MGRWFREDKAAARAVLVLLLVLAAGWSLYGLYGHETIRAAYEGRSHRLLNRAIEGQAGRPLEEYLATADRLAVEASILLALAFFFVLRVARPGRLRRFELAALCACLIVLNLAVILPLTAEDSGWDFTIVCRAMRALEHGDDPYIVENLAKHAGDDFGPARFPFVSPPVCIGLFRGLCFFNRFFSPGTTYRIAWSLLLAASFLFIWRSTSRRRPGPEPLFLAALLATGFMAAYWNFLTGNFALIELALLSVAFYGVMRKKYYLAGAFLTVMGLVKFLPLLFGGLFLLLPGGKRTRAKVIALMLLLFVLVNLASYALAPGLMRSYYMAATGRLPQYSPMQEGGSKWNPSLFFLVEEVAGRLSGNKAIAFPVLYGLYACFIVLAFLTYARREERAFADIFSLGVLALLLLLPRLKPYSFILALPSVYFLTRGLDMRGKFLTLLAVSAGPLLFAGTVWRTGDFLLPGIVRDYGQAIWLLVFFTAYRLGPGSRVIAEQTA